MGEAEIYFKELAHTIVEAGKQEISRVLFLCQPRPAGWKPREGLTGQLESEGRLKTEAPLPQGSQAFFFSCDGMRTAHIMEGNLLI